MPKEYSEWEWDMAPKGMSEKEFEIYKENISKAQEVIQWAKKTKPILYEINNYYVFVKPHMLDKESGYEAPVKPRMYSKTWDVYVTYVFDRKGKKYPESYAKDNGEWIGNYKKETPPTKASCNALLQDWLENCE